MAARGQGGDPRRTLPEIEEGDVRPVVAMARGGVPTWALVGIAVLIGLMLFAMLDARRRAAQEPAEPVRADAFALPAPPPPLMIPPAPAPMIAPQVVAEAPIPPAPPAPAPGPPQMIYVPQPSPMPPLIDAPPAPPRVLAEPALVFDISGTRRSAGAPPAEDGGAANAAPPSSGSSVAGTRARAGSLANRAATVPQGTLIPAVLESALDSTRPGLARAIVSRDVRGFDGTRILIPRGSRLIGEYASEVQPGQRRALVNWTRLIRPDGVTIAIGSPSADPVGRTGMRARVNNHFFERFAGAILQSALNLGVNLAAAEAGNGAVVILPGTLQNGAAQAIQPQQITPTLSVRQGTSISVFVARDLDFTGADARR
jgi:type IV secretion system protein VirB10